MVQVDSNVEVIKSIKKTGIVRIKHRVRALEVNGYEFDNVTGNVTEEIFYDINFSFRLV